MLRPVPSPALLSNVNLPPFPSAEFEWQYDAVSGNLFNPQGTAVYSLDSNKNEWKSLLPSESAPTSTPPPPTSTQSPLPSETPLPTAAAQPTATQQPTATPEPTSTPAELSPAAATTEPAAQGTSGECTLPAPSRLTAGGKARILSNLNFRSSPEIGDNLIRVNPAGMELKIIGGPQCVPYQDSAYAWWNVEMPDGQQGWSAENRLNGSAYYLAPIQ
jgi:hypothetical protein